MFEVLISKLQNIQIWFDELWAKLVSAQEFLIHVTIIKTTKKSWNIETLGKCLLFNVSWFFGFLQHPMQILSWGLEFTLFFAINDNIILCNTRKFIAFIKRCSYIEYSASIFLPLLLQDKKKFFWKYFDAALERWWWSLCLINTAFSSSIDIRFRAANHVISHSLVNI